VDEAGRGPLAGPVIAAVVVLNPDAPIAGLDDSKRLTPSRREKLYELIMERAVAVGLGKAEVEYIDAHDILKATRHAMKKALEQVAPEPDYLLLDAVVLPEVDIPQWPVIDGDRLCASVSAASIIAKVTRDRLMMELDAMYPQYGFARHKGYATREHVEAIMKHGLSPAHRRSFRIGYQQELLPGFGGGS